MKTLNFILHIMACVLFMLAVQGTLPYDFAIMAELFAIYNKIQYK